MNTIKKEQDDSKIENGVCFILFHPFKVTKHERLRFML